MEFKEEDYGVNEAPEKEEKAEKKPAQVGATKKKSKTKKGGLGPVLLVLMGILVIIIGVLVYVLMSGMLDMAPAQTIEEPQQEEVVLDDEPEVDVEVVPEFVTDEVSAPVQGDPVAQNSKQQHFMEALEGHDPEEIIGGFPPGTEYAFDINEDVDVPEEGVITITSCEANPRKIVAQTGDVITFKNVGIEGVTIRFENGTEHIATPGSSEFTVDFPEPGMWRYMCNLSGMIEGVIYSDID